MKRTRSRFFKVKEYHDFRDGRVLVERELISRRKVEKYNYPREWFEEVLVDLEDTYWFFGARFMVENNEPF